MAAWRIVRLQASCVEAVTVLQGADIEPIVLKGGALAATLYANPGLRPMGDLDLLVPAGAMEQAGTLDALALGALRRDLLGRLAHLRRPIDLLRRYGPALGTAGAGSPRRGLRGARWRGCSGG